ncbi:hypothetical protein AC579_8005 [Pseudocercospora musae]|uniref:Uncharacterized protein n=1 Tax=Pseudocercospora musae TaxID=113226 RepID=A0A139I428_9PEZI|nr:hypothetical protein AC579_8005 [Pseudocercospora musae]
MNVGLQHDLIECALTPTSWNTSIKFCSANDPALRRRKAVTIIPVLFFAAPYHTDWSRIGIRPTDPEPTDQDRGPKKIHQIRSLNSILGVFSRGAFLALQGFKIIL